MPIKIFDMQKPNYKKIAIDIGDLLKYDTTINEINRQARAIFNFQMEEFPCENITSSRASLIYKWILSLAKQELEPSNRNGFLIRFCKSISPEPHRNAINKILEENNVKITGSLRDGLDEFLNRNFHEMIHLHSKKYFIEGNYFHSVFEACKIYNKIVKEKSNSDKDGSNLMLDVFSPEKGVLKITACQTETDLNIQNGIKFLSAGLMHAIRNPISHEPALDWPIQKDDCLDMLSFISFLFRKLDNSVYYKNNF